MKLVCMMYENEENIVSFEVIGDLIGKVFDLFPDMTEKEGFEYISLYLYYDYVENKIIRVFADFYYSDTGLFISKEILNLLNEKEVEELTKFAKDLYQKERIEE